MRKREQERAEGQRTGEQERAFCLAARSLHASAAPPQGGQTALIAAAANGKLDCLEYLIAIGTRSAERGTVLCGRAINLLARSTRSATLVAPCLSQ